METKTIKTETTTLKLDEPKPVVKTHTLTVIDFRDSYKSACSLEEVPDKFILFGTLGSRMKLNQVQVQQLMPYLEHFIKTGELNEKVKK